MNGFETRQIITSSLSRGGAFCEPEGKSIIVAKWKTTVWRIFIDSLSADNKKPATIVAVEELQNSTLKKTVIARINPDGHIEYRNAENGKIIRPRCLVKSI